MIRKVFRGVGREELTRDKNVCNCTCYTGGRDQVADHQAEHNPTCTCKCTCYCQAGQANTQRKDDTSSASGDASYEANV